MKIIFLLILALNLSISADSHSAHVPKKVTMSLPVNAVCSPKIHMSFVSEAPFQAPEESYQSFFKGGGLELIPHGETLENWSKIITLNSYVDKGLSAEAVTLAFPNNFAPHTKQLKVIFHSTKKENDYTISRIAIQYELHDGSYQLFYGQYYSGPMDCSGVQYTIKIPAWLDDKAALSKANELQKSIDGMVKIVSFS